MAFLVLIMLLPIIYPVRTDTGCWSCKWQKSAKENEIILLFILVRPNIQNATTNRENNGFNYSLKA